MRPIALAYACAWFFSVTACATVARAYDHPLEPLRKSEIAGAFSAVQARFRADESLPDEALRYSMVALLEPPKSVVSAWSPGRAFPRKATVQVLHYPSNRLWIAEVDLKKRKVTHLDARPPGTQPAVTSEEFTAAEELIRAYAPFVHAMQARGLNPDHVYIDVWAPGDAPLPEEIAATLPNGQRTRLLRCILFYRGASLEDQQPKAPQNPYDRPIEGVVLTVDMNARQVVEMTDTVVHPVISETGNAATARRLKPLVVQEPEGSDIKITGRLVRWHRWQFYAVLHESIGFKLQPRGFFSQNPALEIVDQVED